MQTDARTSKSYAIMGLVGGVLLALVTIVQGLLWGFSDATFPDSTSPWYLPLASLMVLASAGLLLGFVGIHERQAKEAGILGLAGFLVTILGITMEAGVAFMFAFVFPVLQSETPDLLGGAPPGSLMLGFLSFTVILTIGLVLLGIAIYRAGVLPKWAGALVALSGLVNLAPDPWASASAILGGIAVTWLCWTLWTGAGVMEMTSTETETPA